MGEEGEFLAVRRDYTKGVRHSFVQRWAQGHERKKDLNFGEFISIVLMIIG